MQKNPIAMAGGEEVLAYASQQRRWERGVLWLVGSICVAQMLMVPAGVSEWVVFLSGSRFWILPEIKGPGEMIAVGLLLARPVISLVTATCALLALMNVNWAKKGLLYLAWAAVFVTLALALTHVVLMLNPPWDDRLGRRIGLGMGGISHQIIQDIGFAALWNYPLLLMINVFKHVSFTRPRLRARAIWKLTAVAAMLFAAPTVAAWLTDFGNCWDRVIVAVFAIFIGRDWWESIMGIGMISGAMACISAYVATAWTWVRGPGGRWSLMICAALWIVSAVGVYGVDICKDVAHPVYWGVVFLGGAFLKRVVEWDSSALLLRELAAAMLFPVAIRVALSLSDVQEQLDRR